MSFKSFLWDIQGLFDMAVTDVKEEVREIVVDGYSKACDIGSIEQDGEELRNQIAESHKAALLLEKEQDFFKEWENRFYCGDYVRTLKAIIKYELCLRGHYIDGATPEDSLTEFKAPKNKLKIAGEVAKDVGKNVYEYGKKELERLKLEAERQNNQNKNK